MKKPQYITIFIAIAALVLLLAFGRIAQVPGQAHDNGPVHSSKSGEVQDILSSGIAIDSLLAIAKNNLPPQQGLQLDLLEKSITRGDVKQQQVRIYHQLAHFWRDTGKAFIPYAWYTAEGARLENSEKSLTFAGHLLLNAVQQQQNAELRKWLALQSKDLFERSLKLNPDNDSSKVGIGATYIFGGISKAPMEGIVKVREVAEKDSTNVYAQMTLAMGSLMSGQTDKAQERLLTIIRVQPDHAEAHLLLGDLLERKGDTVSAIQHYTKAASLIPRHDIKVELQKRVSELSK